VPSLSVEPQPVAADVPTSGDPAKLRLDEAVQLCTAWVDGLAESSGVRALILKGDTLARQGLRAPRVSADVDVLVEPSHFDDYRAALVRAGWAERPLPFISTRVSPHSVTFVRSGWPCDIDVHRHFPGFLADAEAVFEQLWTRRASTPFAARMVEVPDRLSGILITALHALRDGPSSSRSVDDLAALREVELSAGDRESLASLANATGCDGSLEDFLVSLGVNVRPASTPALREWNARIASQTQGAFPWMVLWRESSWRERPRVAWRALWPTDTDIVLAHPEVERRFRPLMIARFRRLVRGLFGLPQSVRAIRIRGRS
jgi:hypothetical protein